MDGTVPASETDAALQLLADLPPEAVLDLAAWGEASGCPAPPRPPRDARIPAVATLVRTDRRRVGVFTEPALARASDEEVARAVLALLDRRRRAAPHPADGTAA
jgi:hypothetical protein